MVKGYIENYINFIYNKHLIFLNCWESEYCVIDYKENIWINVFILTGNVKWYSSKGINAILIHKLLFINACIRFIYIYAYTYW